VQVTQTPQLRQLPENTAATATGTAVATGNSASWLQGLTTNTSAPMEDVREVPVGVDRASVRSDTRCARRK
jgi:hypothetical protein